MTRVLMYALTATSAFVAGSAVLIAEIPADTIDTSGVATLMLFFSAGFAALALYTGTLLPEKS